VTDPNTEGQPSEPTSGADEAPLPWSPPGSTEGLSTDGTRVSDDAACGVWRAMMAGIDRVDATRKGTPIRCLLS